MNIFRRNVPTISDNDHRKQYNNNMKKHSHQEHHHQMASAAGTSSPPSIFNNVLETMDRFLETEDNLIVQALVTIERRTNISKRYLARVVLIMVVGYLIFSYSFLDFIFRVFMFLYPSYRSFRKLKYINKLSKEEMIRTIKFWIFISFFATVDLILGNLIPMGFFLKGIILVQVVLPQNPSGIEFAYENVVKPVYSYLEHNPHIKQLNQYCQQIDNELLMDLDETGTSQQSEQHFD